MDENTREQIVAAWVNAIQWAGSDNYEDAMGKVQKFIDILNDSFRSFVSLDAVRNFLDTLPPMDAQMEQAILAGLLLLPQLFEHGSKELALKLASSVPPLPSGRKPVLDIPTKQEMCSYVSGLYGKKIPLSIAKQRAAQHFRCSLRTVERAWTERGTILAQEFRVEDILKLLVMDSAT